jgi:hypothetical protein
MLRSNSSFRSAVVAGLLVATAPSLARAQACCAGASAVTPGRLGLMEDELVGVQLKAGSVIGSYQTSRQFLTNPTGVGEYDLEQDVFGAVRLLERGQLALLVPVVETYRRAPTAGSAFGGGIGDVNASARYDLVLAGESTWMPGVALLAGVTFPTGRPPEDARQVLAVDATGVGAFQINGALALEQTFGPWLVSATAMVAGRTSHGGETLAPQVTFLGAVAYTFPNAAALAFSGSYVFEGDASGSNGASIPDSSKSATTFSLSGIWPLSGEWRLIGGTYLNPPFDQLGSNQPADVGLTAGVIRSWM